MKLKALLLAFLLLFTALPTLAQDMTVDEVIAQYIDARGGAEAWEAVETIRMKGLSSFPNGMEAPFTIEFKRPDKIRIENEIQGMTGIQAYDGESGWRVMPFMGKTEPEPIPEGELAMLEEQADLDGPLFDYAEKGHEVELLGKEDLEGTEAYKLKLTRADDTVVYIYLDAEYFLELRSESQREIPQMGGEVNMIVESGDYKEVGGLVFPHNFKQSVEGSPAAANISIEEVELNPELDDSRFAMPSGEGDTDEETKTEG